MIAAVGQSLIFILCVSFIMSESNRVLGMLAIIKNEGMVIKEWIEHYIWQGVDHFYIIDNGSTDNTKEILAEYIKSGIVSYFVFGGRHMQAESYNQIFYSFAQQQCKWLIICDADEYIYNTRRGGSIKGYLNTLDYNRISHVALQWKMFGSSGYETQPVDKIRTSFLWRQSAIHPNTKMIVNTSLTGRLHVHGHWHKPATESIQYPADLALNHYAIMSKEYFGKIKMTRGDVNSVECDNVRDWKYFEEYDHKEFCDTELRDLILDQNDQNQS